MLANKNKYNKTERRKKSSKVEKYTKLLVVFAQPS